jgi:hypothetical protein
VIAAAQRVLDTDFDVGHGVLRGRTQVLRNGEVAAVPVDRDKVPSQTIEVLPKPPLEVAPEVDVRRRAWWNEVFGAVVLLGVSFLLVGTALTIGRFSGPDFGDAKQQATATIESCQLRGPLTGKGFGYYDRCTLSIVWRPGPADRVVIDKPGFIVDDRVGDTFVIGDNGHGHYSRVELPHRAWVSWVAWAIALLGAVPLLVAAIYLRGSLRAGGHRSV